MKKKLLILTLAALIGTAAGHARKGIVVAHYGSSNDETRALTINKITTEIREAAGNDIPVCEAYISPVVRKNMTKRGIESLSPVDAMLAMRARGVDTIVVQPSLIIDGGEMEELRRDVESVSPFFGSVVLGHPLCYSPADFEQVVNILSAEEPDGADAIIFVGHGNELPSTATYTQLDYMLADRGLTDRHVSTIEGYPTAETTVRQLRRSPQKIKTVKLVPFLLVCGNHTLTDIAGEYSDRMRAAGYEPRLLKRGLAELPAIRQIYTDRAIRLLQ
ncbi:MAG: sirohydrochlorin cobaltochelatase [Muribaculaceae bacterium]|nr:sirohydrochlorin cobaltochelatase [Muribaculaceae bacterium]